MEVFDLLRNLDCVLISSHNSDIRYVQLFLHIVSLVCVVIRRCVDRIYMSINTNTHSKPIGILYRSGDKYNHIFERETFTRIMNYTNCLRTMPEAIERKLCLEYPNWVLVSYCINLQ